MTIVVFGAGGVGTFFGALLARSGRHDLWFVARGAQLEALQTRGISIRSPLIGDLQLPPVRATSDPAEIGTADLVLVCVKAHQTRPLLDQIAPLVAAHTILVTMQNGVDSDEVLASRFGRAAVVPCAVYVAATLESPGVVTQAAPARLLIGAREGFDPSRLEAVRTALADTGQPVEISDDIQTDRWKKLVWNAAFNPLTAITGRLPEDLLARASTRTLVVGLMKEVIAVARAHGARLHDSDAEALAAWTERMPGIRTSTQVDRQRGRQMERDALLGVVVERARLHGISAPMAQSVFAIMEAVDVA